VGRMFKGNFKTKLFTIYEDDESDGSDIERQLIADLIFTHESEFKEIKKTEKIEKTEKNLCIIS
jgi:hypothetical protein